MTDGNLKEEILELSLKKDLTKANEKLEEFINSEYTTEDEINELVAQACRKARCNKIKTN